jgi:hypothetical protein
MLRRVAPSKFVPKGASVKSRSADMNLFISIEKIVSKTVDIRCDKALVHLNKSMRTQEL